MGKKDFDVKQEIEKRTLNHSDGNNYFEIPQWQDCPAETKENRFFNSQLNLKPVIEINAKHPGGRPTKYKPEYIAEVKSMCLSNLGITDEQIAERFNISTATLYEWKKLYPEFAEAIAFGKIKADDMVAESLFLLTQRRIEKVEKVFQYRGEIVRAVAEEIIQPSEKACLSWLNTRRGWRNGIDLDGDGALHIVVQPGALAGGWSPTKPAVAAEISGGEDGDEDID